jgi:hypothetical protein
MRGSIPPLPNTPSWRGAKLKLRDSFTFYLIHEESVQSLLASRLFPKNLRIKIQKTTILPVVLYGCETWPLTLRNID